MIISGFIAAFGLLRGINKKSEEKIFFLLTFAVKFVRSNVLVGNVLSSLKDVLLVKLRDISFMASFCQGVQK